MRADSQRLFVLITSVVLIGVAFGQTATDESAVTVRLSGRVIDPTGAPIPHVSVTLRIAGSAEAKVNTRTDENGRYSFRGILPNTYDFYFERDGFKTRSLDSVKVFAGKDATPSDVVMDWVIDDSGLEVPYHSAPLPQSLSLERDSQKPAIRTTVCELVREPQRFSGKMVSVRGRILIGFEDFRLDTANCGGKRIEDVWLEYGTAPKRQPTTWCCGGMVPQDPLRLVENNDFKAFHRYLTAQSRTKNCHEGQCYRYEVTATLTGRFDSVETVTCPNGKSQCPKNGGFGHFGMACSRIVIQSVTDVDAKPAGASDRGQALE